MNKRWSTLYDVTLLYRCKGDSDPVDVVEIGRKLHKRGSVVVVKVLGTLAMIDEGDFLFPAHEILSQMLKMICPPFSSIFFVNKKIAIKVPKVSLLRFHQMIEIQDLIFNIDHFRFHCIKCKSTVICVWKNRFNFSRRDGLESDRYRRLRPDGKEALGHLRRWRPHARTSEGNRPLVQSLQSERLKSWDRIWVVF